MNVSAFAPPASPSALSAPVSTALGGAGMGRDSFLKMLVAQLSNQDPMNPQQGHEFAAQLAQFSSVEQLTQIGASMDQQAGQLAELLSVLGASATQQAGANEGLARSLSVQAASALIGQAVEVNGNAAAWDGSTPVVMGADVPAGTGEAALVVRDAGGRVVRTLPLGTQDGAARTATWDGRGEDGEALPPGRYTFAAEHGGKPLDAPTFTRGTVSRVTIEASGAKLWLGDTAYALGALRSVSARS